MKKLTNSFSLLERAKRVVPGQTHTFSKGYYSYVEGIYPVFLESGKGSHVCDVDDNEYIDYILGIGPILLGYSYDIVNDKVISQIKQGTIFSMPHRSEVELAELMTKVVPFVDAAKFTKTGSDAVTAALRASRAITGKNKVAYCGGGGVWHDWFTSITSRNLGVPDFNKKLIKFFQYNDIESLKKILDLDKDVGTVIMEPMTSEFPKNGFLDDVKKTTHDHDALLIFDEVQTGFRMSLGGASEYFNVFPDLAAFGKGMANGYPLGAIAGSAEYMRIFDDIFYSTTFGGETASLVAGMATIEELKEKNILSSIYKNSLRFFELFNKLSVEHNLPISTIGFPSRQFLLCKDNSGFESLLVKSLFCQEMAKNGILIGQGPIFHSYSHNEEDMAQTIDAAEKAMKVVKEGLSNNNIEKLLEGKPMKRVLTFPV